MPSTKREHEESIDVEEAAARLVAGDVRVALEKGDTDCEALCEEALDRYVREVRAKRNHPNAKSMKEMTVEQMTFNDGDSPVLYIPEKHRDRILRLYGGWKLTDFDDVFGFNSKIGAVYETGLQTMMFYMNETNGHLADQAAKLNENPSLHDAFNIIQSAVRSRINEAEWYERA